MEGSFRALDGVILYEQWCHPPSEPKAVVGIVHGICEHSGRYKETADYLTGRGFAVDTFDLRGHGKSGGEALHIDSFYEYLDDLDIFIGRVRERTPDKPLFLLGHSMGGGILLLYAITRRPDIRGLIVNAPYAKMSKNVSPLKRKLVSFFGRAFPRMPLVKLDAGACSRDPQVLRCRENDKLVHHGKLQARTVSELLQLTRQIQARLEDITCPLLILHGSDDRLAEVEGSKMLHSRVKSAEKTLKIYPGLFHETLHEPEKEMVWQDIADWMEAYIRSVRE